MESSGRQSLVLAQPLSDLNAVSCTSSHDNMDMMVLRRISEDFRQLGRGP